MNVRILFGNILAKVSKEFAAGKEHHEGAVSVYGDNFDAHSAMVLVLMDPTMSDDDEVVLQTRKFRPRVEAMLLLLLLVVLVVVVNEPLDVVLRLHYHVESSC